MVDLTAEHLLDGMSGITYLTDHDGAMLALGRPNWNAFAAANGGQHLIDGRGVVGRSLFEFVAGEEVKAYYRKCLKSLSGQGRTPVRLVSRCDGPGVKRELLITMSSVVSGPNAGYVLFQSTIVAEEVRPALDLFDFQGLRAKNASRGPLPILAMCSYCQNVRHPVGSTEKTGLWVSAAEYYRLGGHSDVRISHGICPLCLTRVEQTLAA
jgi:hypothetical protein